MKTILKFIWNTLAVIGLFAVVLVGIATYVVSTNPFLQSIPSALFSPQSAQVENVDGDAIDKHPVLSQEQEQALQSAGVDVSALPQNITPEMESCFVDKLGQARVKEIQAGSEPTVTDFFKASSCLGQ